MTATKRITRLGAIFLLVIFLVSSMATMALAAQKSVCCTTSSKTFTIKKSYGKAIKVTATQKGRVMQSPTATLDTSAKHFGWYYGRYKVTIKYPGGEVDSFTWDSQKNPNKTFVGAFKRAGTYTITISEVYEPTVLKHVWSHCGFFWRTYPQFTMKY